MSERVELKIDDEWQDVTEHCRSNLLVPLAPWLLAQAVRRVWRWALRRSR